MFAGRGRFAFPWRNRRRVRRDDTGSMPLALLVTLVGVTLSAGLSGLVVGQIKDTRRLEERVAAVAAAQAGLDAGLAKIRAAADSSGGLLGMLPCTDAFTSAGLLNGNGAGAFSTTVGYFMVDPSGQVRDLQAVGPLNRLSSLKTASLGGVDVLIGQLGSAVSSTTAGNLQELMGSVVSCAKLTNGGVPPLFGLLRSTGTVNGVTRTLYATYTFHTDQETIPGGRITIGGTNGLLCLGSGSANPKAGDPVLAVSCTQNNKLVSFSYLDNLNLALSLSRYSPKYPAGLCITVAAQALNEPVEFEECKVPRDTTQQWQYEVNWQTYYAATLDSSNNVVRSGYCLSMATPSILPGGAIVLKNGGACGTANAFGQSFVPDQSAGAGAAGAKTGQLVNNGEIGRCLDLTNEDPAGTWATKKGEEPALISYPCKQAFDSNVYWNHKWYGPIPSADLGPDKLFSQTLQPGKYSSTGQVYVKQPSGGSYKLWCLNSPGPGGGRVWVAQCSTGGANLLWTVYDAAPSTAESYRIVDSYGNCLEAAGARGAAYVFGKSSLGTISYVISAPCTAEEEQKWNAPASEHPGPLKAISER